MHITLSQCRVGHNHAEKVAPGPMGLVANHHGALLHHALLEYRGHLWKGCRMSSCSLGSGEGGGLPGWQVTQDAFPSYPREPLEVAPPALILTLALVYLFCHSQPAWPSLPSALFPILPIFWAIFCQILSSLIYNTALV